MANTHLFWNPKAAIVRVLHCHGLMTKISSVYNELREQYGTQVKITFNPNDKKLAGFFAFLYSSSKLTKE